MEPVTTRSTTALCHGVTIADLHAALNRIEKRTALTAAQQRIAARTVVRHWLRDSQLADD